MSDKKFIEFVTTAEVRVLIKQDSIAYVEEDGEGTVLYLDTGCDGICLSESYVDVVSKLVL